MQNLTVTTIQTSLHWESITANLDQFSKLFDQIDQPTDLIILPEMFTTGFSMQPEQLAEPMDGPTIHWLKEKAQALNAVITGSIIIEEEGAYYNRLIWMTPSGEYEVYDKRHLFTLAGEHQHYQPGTQSIYPILKGWKVCPLICYDLRFPVWSRNTVDYHLLIYMANWPDKRRNAWKALLMGRAIENQAYTIGVNRVGEDANGHYYSGDTSIIDYSGQVLYHAAHFSEVQTHELSWDNQEAFRNKLNFLADKDSFTIAT